MKKIDTVRALRDSEYRNSLSEAEQAALPAPAGVANVVDGDLKSVTGGCGTPTTIMMSCVPPSFNSTFTDVGLVNFARPRT